MMSVIRLSRFFLVVDIFLLSPLSEVVEKWCRMASQMTMIKMVGMMNAVADDHQTQNLLLYGKEQHLPVPSDCTVRVSNSVHIGTAGTNDTSQQPVIANFTIHLLSF